MIDTSTPEGRAKRLKEIVDGHIENKNWAGVIRLVGGSVEDWDERYDPSMSGGHPDEIRN